MNELERVAKDLYTSQRGRVLGNTTAWDDLPEHQRLNIVQAVEDALEYMKEGWQWAGS